MSDDKLDGKLNDYRIDQALFDETKSSHLNSHEMQGFIKRKAYYRQLETQLAKSRPQFVASPVRRFLLRNPNLLSVKSIFLTSIAATAFFTSLLHDKDDHGVSEFLSGKTSQEAIDHSRKGQLENDQPHVRIASAPKVLAGQLTPGGVAKVQIHATRNRMLHSFAKMQSMGKGVLDGDLFSFAITLPEPGQRFVQIVAVDGVDQSISGMNRTATQIHRIYPQAEQSATKVIFSPTWHMPYRYLATGSRSDWTTFYLVISEQLEDFSMIMRKLEHDEAERGGLGAAFHLKGGESALEVQRFSLTKH